jgi:hypothetical protein
MHYKWQVELIREIEAGEKIADIVDEAKYLTRQEGKEHAVIKAGNGKRYLISGGEKGIELPKDTKILYGHTHPNLPGATPFNNGPSAADRQALDMMNPGKGQSKQYIYHDGQRSTLYRSGDIISTTNY